MTAAEAKAAIKSMKRKMEDKNTSSKKTKVEAAPVNGMVSINAFYFFTLYDGNCHVAFYSGEYNLTFAPPPPPGGGKK